MPPQLSANKELVGRSEFLRRYLYIELLYLVYTLVHLSPPPIEQAKERRMRSALRSVLSAAGVGLICLLLAKATWEQVLLLFLLASFGWCLIAWQRENNRALYGPRPVIRRRREMVESYVGPAQATLPAGLPVPASQSALRAEQAQRRTIYRFPIHELARSTKPRAAEPEMSV